MSHTIELLDEQYAALETYAQQQGRSPDELIHAWVASVAEQPQMDWRDVPPPTEEELRNSPFLRVMGSLAIDGSRLTTEFDEVLAEAIADDHANEE